MPLALDVLAAGIAVVAHASFFNMPWRMVATPVITGMVAQALRWKLLQLGIGVPMGALGATLVAGTVMALVSHRLRLPFGAVPSLAWYPSYPASTCFKLPLGWSWWHGWGRREV